MSPSEFSYSEVVTAVDPKWDTWATNYKNSVTKVDDANWEMYLSWSPLRKNTRYVLFGILLVPYTFRLIDGQSRSPMTVCLLLCSDTRMTIAPLSFMNRHQFVVGDRMKSMVCWEKPVFRCNRLSAWSEIISLLLLKTNSRESNALTGARKTKVCFPATRHKQYFYWKQRIGVILRSK